MIDQMWDKIVVRYRVSNPHVALFHKEGRPASKRIVSHVYSVNVLPPCTRNLILSGSIPSACDDFSSRWSTVCMPCSGDRIKSFELIRGFACGGKSSPSSTTTVQEEAKASMHRSWRFESSSCLVCFWYQNKSQSQEYVWIHLRHSFKTNDKRGS